MCIHTIKFYWNLLYITHCLNSCYLSFPVIIFKASLDKKHFCIQIYANDISQFKHSFKYLRVPKYYI